MEETYDIFVGSLLSSSTQDSVTNLFGKFGKIVKVKILDKPSQNGLKYAFIHYGKEEHALKAIEDMKDYMLNGVPIQVRKSDRWLKRIGDKPVSKGSILKKPLIKSQSNSSGIIGVWQPPSSAGSCSDGQQCGKDPNSFSRTEMLAVTHVEDPVTFYAYYSSKNSELDSLTGDLQSFCLSSTPILGDPNDSQVYASKYSLDNQWYRCKIKSVDRNLSRSVVQYIDYGNVEKVSNCNLVELPPRLSNIPDFTMKCVLKNMSSHTNNSVVYEEALDFLKRMLIDQMVSAVFQTCGKGKPLLVSAINQNGSNIVESMIQKGYLIPNISSNIKRNSSTHNGVGLGNNIVSQGGGTDRSRKPIVSDHVSNFNNVAFNLEKTQLESENKRLKYENAKSLGKIKALQTELQTITQSLAEPNPFTELPSVICDVEKVRHLREQLPVRPNSLDYIDTAVRLLRKSEDCLRPLDKEHRETMQNNVLEYLSLQERILNCSDKDELTELISCRNNLQEKLHKELTTFCDAIHSSGVEVRIQTYKTVLSEIQRIYVSFLKMKTFSETALPLEELYSFYTSTKTEKAKDFLSVQRKTDLAHRNFFKELQPTSQNLDQGHVKMTSVPELTQNLVELKTCLANEIQLCSLEDSEDASVIGVISQLLCENLKKELESIEEIKQLESNFRSLLDTLSSGLSGTYQPDIEQLMEKRKDRKKLKSQLRHILADKMDLEENDEASDSETKKINERLSAVRSDLHKTFVDEDKLIARLSELQATAFPELNNLYPDFGLREYNRYKGLVKSGLEIEHFDVQPLASTFPSITCYSSTFIDKAVRLLEFQLVNEQEKEDLLQCVLTYAAASHPHLLSVDAVFFTKKCVHAYVQQPLLPSLQSIVEESDLHTIEKISVLKDVLNALEALHHQGLVHGHLHPGTVLLSPEKQAILDSVSFQPHKSTETLPAINGILFQVPSAGNSSRSCHDIYAFANLCIWLMYPKTTFQMSPSGKPVLHNLSLDEGTSQVLDLVNHIWEAPTPNIQAKEIINHPALNPTCEVMQLLLVPEVQYTDPATEDQVPELEQMEEEHDKNSMILDPEEKTEGTADIDCNDRSNVEEEYCASTEEESDDNDNAEETILAYDSIRQNLCSLGITETQNA